MNKLVFDLFPIILFFVAYKLGDIYTATGVAIVATIGQIVWLRLRRRPVEVMQWLSLGVIVVFGGLTIWLQDETFIKWKPTILYWLFGAGLVAARLAGRNLMKTLMGGQLALPEPVWDRLNLIWAGYFTAMGLINLWVAYTFATDAWVNFKLFGTLALTVVFVIGQGIYLGRYLNDDARPAGGGAGSESGRIGGGAER